MIDEEVKRKVLDGKLCREGYRKTCAPDCEFFIEEGKCELARARGFLCETIAYSYPLPTKGNQNCPSSLRR